MRLNTTRATISITQTCFSIYDVRKSISSAGKFPNLHNVATYTSNIRSCMPENAFKSWRQRHSVKYTHLWQPRPIVRAQRLLRSRGSGEATAFILHLQWDPPPRRSSEPGRCNVTVLLIFRKLKISMNWKWSVPINYFMEIGCIVFRMTMEMIYYIIWNYQLILDSSFWSINNLCIFFWIKFNHN